MKYRKLGKTDILVSTVGYGCWGIGGDAYGPVDDSESTKSLSLAYDRGINFFDTADVYGDGHSEEVLGKALKDIRKKIVIATKGGTKPHYGFEMPQDFSAKNMIESFEKSLRRLMTDYIDLYQLHSPPGEFIRNTDEVSLTFDALNGLKRNGKIRALGISVRSPSDGLFVAENLDVDFLQVNYNLIDQRAQEIGLFDYCKKKGIGIIARTPLAFGFISGRYAPGQKFSAPDHRANWPQEQIDRWAASHELFTAINEKKKRTNVHLALQFCISDDAVATVIPGMLTRKEVEENAQAADLPPLTLAELKKIKTIYQTQYFFDANAKSNAMAKNKED